MLLRNLMDKYGISNVIDVNVNGKRLVLWDDSWVCADDEVLEHDGDYVVPQYDRLGNKIKEAYKCL